MAVLRKILTIAVVCLTSIIGTTALARAGEEATIQAFSAWQGQGQVVQTSPGEATFVGFLSGPFYINTEQGPVDAGSMVCPAVVRINLKDRTQSGSGDCTLTGERGLKVFMVLNCKGVHLVGCTGDAKFTGGTGKFAGISGGGHFVIRSRMDDIISQADFTAKETANGIIFWRELHYKIP
jgi:hypothetical protein